MDGYTVTPDDLRTAASKLGGIADGALRGVARLSGVQTALGDQATGFELMRAAVDVESSWQRAIQLHAARLALDGDLLGISADTYVESDKLGRG